jgi:predicted phosphohydrolase
MKLAWATDIHLDCVNDAVACVEKLAESSMGCDGVVISGDLSTSPLIVDHLRLLNDCIQKPIYFVLGNHDYYYSDIISTRKRVVEVCRNLPFCRYLGSTSYINVGRSTAIVGSDGWYDALNGNPDSSELIMNDWLMIADFKLSIKNNLRGKSIDRNVVAHVARQICKASVDHIARGIKSVVNDVDKIIIITHVPPFVESYTNSKFKGSPDENIVPWYTSRIMGEMLRSAAKTYQHIQFTVLSGHTHSPFEGNIFHNLHAKVGKSQYGAPQIVGYIDT